MNPFKMLKEFLRWRKVISTSENYIEWLRSQGVRIGDNVTIYGRENIVMDTTRPWLIEIGNNVEITAGATILTHGYDWCVIQKRDGRILGSAGKVTIHDNVFIGVNVTILPGTDIGENVIVGAGSVVKGCLERDSVYAGVPARRILSLQDYIEKRDAAQLSEAVMMVKEYQKVFKKDPPIETMHEHFWLFANRMEGLNQIFLDKLALRGNFSRSSAAFLAHSPEFENYEAFLAYCKQQKSESV